MSQSDIRTASRTSPAFLALSCVGFIASAPAAAQTETPPADAKPSLGSMAITESAITDEGYKAERKESPKAVAPLLDTPRSVVVVDKQVIKDTGSATLIEALRTVPGITFGAAEGGNPIGDRPFIRGFDSQGSTFLDGVRDVGSQSREVFAVEQIQVVRGSDSTTGGRGSVGGALNIISKLPEQRDFVAGSASYGTDNYKRVTGDVNYRISDNVAVRLNGMWHDQDVAGRDSIWQKRWGVAPSVKIGGNGPTSLTIAYYHLKTSELPDSGLPYSYICNATTCNTPATGFSYSEPAVGNFTTIGGVASKISPDTFYGLKDRDFRKTKIDQASMRFEHELVDGIKWRNTSRFSRTVQAYIYTQPDDSQGNVYGTPTTAGGLVWRRANTRFGYTESFINQSDVYGTFDTGSITHSFSVGGEISFEKAERGAYVLATGSTISPRCSATQIARYNCTSLFSPNASDPWLNYTSDTASTTTPITKGIEQTRTTTNAHTYALYGFDSITLTDQLILNLGLRWEEFGSKVRPGIAATASPSTLFTLSRTDRDINWQAGLIFKPTANTSIYASYATSSTPPNALVGEGQEQNALGTTNTASALGIFEALKVEKSKSYEAGAKADLFDGALSLNVAVFRTETDNARVTIDANTVQFIGKKRVEGVEFGFNGNITPEWNVFGGYSYLDAKTIDGGFSALTAAAIMNGTTVVQAAKTVYVTSVNTGRRFPQTAKHSFTAWTNYQITPAFSIGGGAFYMSRVIGGYADNRAATQTNGGVVTVSPATKIIARAVPSYWRFDARAGYKINDNLDMSINVQNLTDKRYFSQAYSSHYATIAAGRSAFATINFRY